MVEIPAGMGTIRARYIPIQDEFTMAIPADAVLLGVGRREEHAELWYAVSLPNENPHRYRLFFWRRTDELLPQGFSLRYVGTLQAANSPGLPRGFHDLHLLDAGPVKEQSRG